jgi:hypothetical protein
MVHIIEFHDLETLSRRISCLTNAGVCSICIFSFLFHYIKLYCMALLSKFNSTGKSED